MQVTSHQPMPQRECDSGEKRCMDTLLLTCRSDGQWNDGTQCAYACVDGACTGECVPDNQQCHDSTLRHCDQNGEWQDVMTCPKVCSGDRLRRQVRRRHAPVQRSRSAHLHQRRRVRVRQDLRLRVQVAARASASACPTTRAASNGVQETCDADGQWGSPANCEFVCAGNVCGGECVPDDTQCTDGTHVKTCGKNGMWGSPTRVPVRLRSGKPATAAASACRATRSAPTTRTRRPAAAPAAGATRAPASTSATATPTIAAASACRATRSAPTARTRRPAAGLAAGATRPPASTSATEQRRLRRLVRPGQLQLQQHGAVDQPIAALQQRYAGARRRLQLSERAVRQRHRQVRHQLDSTTSASCRCCRTARA